MSLWTEEEIKLVLLLSKEKSTPQVAIEIGRTAGSVKYKLAAMGIRLREMRGTRTSPQPAAWTKEQIAFLKKNHKKYTLPQLAAQIGRSPHAVKVKCSRLNLYRRRRGWSYELMSELIRLRKEEKLDWCDLAQKLNRTARACKSKYYYLTTAV